MKSPLPWTTREFGYERHAILDANGAEVAEVVRRGDAQAIVEVINGAEGAPEGSGDVRVLAEQQARAARLFSQGRDQERISAVARALAREASTWEVAAIDTVWRHLALAALATDADYRAALAGPAGSTGEATTTKGDE